MKKYKVTASSITYFTIEIEAESEDAAWMEAKYADGSDFIPDGEGDWEIMDIKEVTA